MNIIFIAGKAKTVDLECNLFLGLKIGGLKFLTISLCTLYFELTNFNR